MPSLDSVKECGRGFLVHCQESLTGMNRVKVVQQALDGRVKPVYLEIGVARGWAFRLITADEKIAVDPAFKLSARSRGRADAKARATHYFEMTSDVFFANQTALLERHGIDVALVDGNHTYGQALHDVENTLHYLRDDGVIVLHDCNPPRALVAFPAPSRADFRAQNHWWNWIWSGDVWKVIVHLRSMHHDLRVAVLNCDYGVGVVRKGVPESRLSFSPAQIEALNYADLAADRERLLNLKPPGYLGKFLTEAPNLRK
jgi:Methyltransferase domain